MAISKLINNLEEQCAIYQVLKEYGEKKKDVLVSGDIESLEEIVKKEQNVIIQARELEKNRAKLDPELKEELGIRSDDDLTINKVIQQANGENREKLDNLYDTLNSLLVDLKELNVKNNSLIEQSLTYVNFSLEMFTGQDQDPGTYSDKGVGEEGKKKSKSLLDQKI